MNKCFLGQKKSPLPPIQVQLGPHWTVNNGGRACPRTCCLSVESALLTRLSVAVCLRGQKGLVLLDVPKQGESQRRPALLQRRGKTGRGTTGGELGGAVIGI